MRTPLEIIAELKHVTHWSQPNIKFGETMALINELETTLTVDEIINNPIEFTEPTKAEIESFNEALADFLEIEDEVIETIEVIEEIKVIPPIPTKPKATPKTKPSPKK
jgi:hypothetical protein